jgi:hypothetical protein
LTIIRKHVKLNVELEGTIDGSLQDNKTTVTFTELWNYDDGNQPLAQLFARAALWLNESKEYSTIIAVSVDYIYDTDEIQLVLVVE